MNEVSITRKTVLHWMLATVVASLLVIGVLIFSIGRYRPQYYATAVLREQSYEEWVQQASDETDAILDRKRKKGMGEDRTRTLHRRLVSDKGLQHVVAVCEQGELEALPWDLEEFDRRVTVRRRGEEFTIEVAANDAPTAATIANGLAEFGRDDLRPANFREDQAYYREGVRILEQTEKELASSIGRLEKLIGFMRGKDPKFEEKHTFTVDDQKTLLKLGEQILERTRREARLEWDVLTLRQMRDEDIPYDKSELKKLEADLESTRAALSQSETEIHKVWTQVVKGDMDFLRIHQLRLEKGKAGRVVKDLTDALEPLPLKRCLEIADRASAPLAPDTGRPVLQMILLSALAIALPFLVAYRTQRTQADQRPEPRPVGPNADREMNVESS